MDIDEFSLEQGTIEFWVKADEFKWNDNQELDFFEASKKEGRVVVKKDKDNQIKGIYQVGDKKAITSIDVSDLDEEEKHQVGLTWSQDDNEVNLYLDGEKVDQKNIN